MSKAVEQVNSCTSKTVGQLVWLIDTQNLNLNFKRFDHFDDYNFTIVLKNGPTRYSHCLCSNKFWFCPIYCWPYFLKTKFIISSLLTWSWAGMSLMQMVELLWTDCCQYSQMFSVKKLVFHFINYRPFSNWYVCLQWEYKLIQTSYVCAAVSLSCVANGLYKRKKPKLFTSTQNVPSSASGMEIAIQ